MNKILIPRRSPEERMKNYVIAINRQIQQYIKNGSKGNLDLNSTPIQKLPDNLITIGGDGEFQFCEIKNLNNLQKVDGHLVLNNSDIEYLSKNLKIEGNLYIRNTPLSFQKSKEEIISEIEKNGGYIKGLIYE
jgi:hypothetical protein